MQIFNLKFLVLNQISVFNLKIINSLKIKNYKLRISARGTS